MLRSAVVVDEIVALASLKGVAAAELDGAIALLAPHLGVYAELVVTAAGIEIITGGVGNATARDLARIATVAGARTCDAFLACTERFPDRMLGLKLCFGAAASFPTLYLRTLAPRADVLSFVATLPDHAGAVPALSLALAGNEVLYGLGFSTTAAGQPLLKTYSLDDVSALGSHAMPGFVSFRAMGAAVAREVKRYLPDLAWSELPDGFGYEQVRALVGCERVGHLGVVESPGVAPQVKLYLERVGAVASDFSLR